MVDDQVLLPDGGEAIAGMLADALGKARIVRDEFEVGAIDRGELRQFREREHAVHHEHLVFGDSKRAPHEAPQVRRHGGVEFQANDRTTPAALEHGLEQAHQVFRLFLDFEVGIADHPERPLPFDGVAGEQLGDEQRGDLLQGHQARGAVRRRWNADEAFDLLGHADERVHRFAVAGTHEMQRQREAQIGNERERMGGIDGERRQYREDVAEEMVGEPGPIVLLELLRLDQNDIVGGKLSAQVAPTHLLVDGETGYGLVDAAQLLGRGQAVRTAGEDAGAHLALEAGDTHHEEFVEIVGGNRQEPHPLQQRMIEIARLLEHATVEMEPGQFAVDESVRPGRGKDGRRIGAGALQLVAGFE